MNAEDYEWIGITYPEDVKASVTFVTPLAYYSGEVWKPLARDARHQWFPSNGKAARFTRDFPSVYINRLCLFRPEQNTQLNATIPGYSRYFIDHELEPVPLAQILNWTTRVSNTFDALDLLDQGIDARDCYCQRVYISCQSRLFGPIRVELDDGQYRPREYIQSSDTGGQPLFIWVYTKPEDGTLNLNDTHMRLALLDESMLDTPTGKEDWSLPQVAIKQVLQASNEALASVESYVHLVDERIRDLAHLYSKAGHPAVHLDAATLKHAQYILSNQVDRLQELRSVFEQLSVEHPLMKIARKWEIHARSHEIEQEPIALPQEKQERLQQLQSEIQEAEATLHRLQNAADETQKSQQQAIETMNAFEQTVRERLAVLKNDPLRILAEHQITASLLPMLVDGSIGSTQPAHEMRTPSSYSSAVRDSYYSEPQETVSMSGLDWGLKDDAEIIQVSLYDLQLQKWRQIAQQTRVNVKDVRICAAALLAGLVPALVGEVAIPTLRAVAQIIAHGRVSLVPIPLTALSAVDLFGAIDPHRQAFIPSNGLADGILEAQVHPDELVIVVLEGIDRVPGMPTYVPLLRQYIEARQGDSCAKSSTPVNLFHPRAVATNDPYLELTSFTWPNNILLATTLDDLNSLAVPSICDRWLVRRATSIKEDTPYAHKTAPACSSVSLERWRTWKEEVSTNSANNTDLRDQLDQRQKLFHTALTILKIKDPDAVVERTWPEQFQQDEEEAK